MKAFYLVLKGLGVTTGILSAGVLIGWLVIRGTYEAKPEHTLAKPSIAASPRASTEDLFQTEADESMNVSPAWASPVLAERTRPLNTEDQFEQILSSETTDLDKAHQLLDLLPQLPSETQADAALLACDLVPESNSDVLGQYFANTAISEPARQAIVISLLQRPGSVPGWLKDFAAGRQAPASADLQMIVSTVLEQEGISQ